MNIILIAVIVSEIKSIMLFPKIFLIIKNQCLLRKEDIKHLLLDIYFPCLILDHILKKNLK